MSSCSDLKMQLTWKWFNVWFSRCFTALSVQCQLRSSSLWSSFPSSQPLLGIWRSCKGDACTQRRDPFFSATLRHTGMGETRLGSTKPGDMPSSSAWGPRLCIVQSSLKADVVPPHLGVPAIVGNKSEERPGYHERSPALAPTLDSPPKNQPYRVWEIGHPKHGAVMGHQPLFQLLPGSHLVPRTPPKSPCLSSLLLVPEIKQRTGCQGQDLPTLNWASRNWTPKSEPVTVGSTNNHWREIIIYSSDLDTFPQWDE